MPITQIGKYQIVRPLGQGGFGAVYLAEDPTLKTQVAIKVFSISDPQLAQQATSATSEAGVVLRDRFLNEARILRELDSNPNIVNIYEFDQMEDGTPYYVMPYLTHSLVDDIGKDALTTVAVQDLDPELRPRKLPVIQVVQILEQVLNGLKAVHKAGLIHRDIKPANILFDKHGNALLCDFGIAKAPDAKHSHTGMAMGSRNYMSPEQRESAKHVSSRSDVYSVAVMTYRMLTGTLPVDRWEDPIAFSPNMGQALNDLIIEAMSNDLDKRPADAAEFLSLLHQAVKDIDGDAPEVSEYTATEMGESPQAISNELKPLQDRIKSLLLENVELNEDHRDQLEMSAGMLDIDNAQLDQLIKATEKQIEPELKPLKNFVNVVRSKLAQNNGQLPESQQTMLIELGEQNGLDRTTLENLMQATLAKAGVSAAEPAPEPELETTPPPEPTEPNKQPQQPVAPQEEKRSNAPLIAILIALLIGCGVAFWIVQENKTPDIPEFVDDPVIPSEPEEVDAPEVIEEPEPREVTSHQLWVNARPANAQISIDGSNDIYEPGMSLPAGKYFVTVSAPGYESHQMEVDLRTNSRKLNVELQKLVQTRQLWVNTNPSNAKVILPDIGPSYSPGMRLKAGKYRVKVKASGYHTKTQWVDLTHNNQTLTVTLQRISNSNYANSAGTSIPTAQQIMARAGKWIDDYNINMTSQTEPGLFKHYFVVTSGHAYISSGTIVTGIKWDGTTSPFWTPVYGYAAKNTPKIAKHAPTLTYLGSKWKPEFREISKRVRAHKPDPKDISKMVLFDPDRSSQSRGSSNKPRIPTAQEIIAKAGKWVDDYNINMKSKSAPSMFKHYFVVTSGHSYISSGTIVTGIKWDGTTSPFWSPVYGYASSEYPKIAKYAHTLTYLGSQWKPEFKEISRRVRAHKPDPKDISKMVFFDPDKRNQARDSIPTAQQIMAKAGKWIDDYNINMKSRTEPNLFKHYFVVTSGHTYISSGTIVTGIKWDGTTSPFWSPVYGYASKDHPRIAKHAPSLTYLGSKWKPEFKEISERVRAHNPDPRDISKLVLFDPDRSSRSRSSIPSARKIVADAGKWINDYNINMESRSEPGIFKHYFVLTSGHSYISSGTIVTGIKWDGTTSPFWTPVYGYASKDTPRIAKYANSLTYLGSTWKPEFREISKQVRQYKPDPKDISKMILFDKKR